MQLKESLRVARSRDHVVEKLCSDDTLLALIPGETEIVDRGNDQITTRTRYRALSFAKVCDGRVWRELAGSVTVEEDGEQAARVDVEMKGRTKALIPEVTIKGPMADQMSAMVEALGRLLAED